MLPDDAVDAYGTIEAHGVGDVGAEDWEFPDARELSPAEAIRLWDAIERESAEAGKRKKRLTERKAIAQQVAIEVVKASGQTGARAAVASGREFQITPYEWDAFTVVDPVAWEAWLEEHPDERAEFYDSSPKIREQVWMDAMRLRVQDRQPLPPGVKRWTDTRISKTAVPTRKGRRPVENPAPEE